MTEEHSGRWVASKGYGIASDCVDLQLSAFTGVEG